MSVPDHEIEFAPEMPLVDQHSWHSASLLTRAANPPGPPTIGGLLYPGKRSLLSGKTEAFKTWLALILAKAEIDAGFPVIWADLDAMGPGELLDRLRQLGLSDDLIDKFFLYKEPDGALRDGALDVCDEVRARGVRLFVIDAFNPMLQVHGLDPASTPDIESFWSEVATPITRAGAAPTCLDHVAKNEESRGKYSYGSERKASGAHVHIGFRLLHPLARGATGSALLATHKDRPGFLPRPNVGKLVLESDGASVVYRLEEERSATDGFRPTVLMERVSRALEARDEPAPKVWIEENVQGKGAAVRRALDILVDEGFVKRESTSRGAFHVSLKPYREADDQPPSDLVPTSSRPRPELRSRPSSPDVVPSSHPLGGDEGRGEAETSPPVLVLTSSLTPSPLIGDEGHLDALFGAFEKGVVTEDEWQECQLAHRFVRAAGMGA